MENDQLGAGTVCWRVNPEFDKEETLLTRKRRPASRQSCSWDVEILVVHRPKYQDISFPKGKAEAHESLAMTAFRETLEETGITTRLGYKLGVVKYTLPTGKNKQIHYWTAKARLTNHFVPNQEVNRLEWLKASEILQVLSYASDREMAKIFLADHANNLLKTDKTLILLSHAQASSPGSDTGLSLLGQEQARRLPAILSPWKPDKIYCSPTALCQQTVLPLADFLSTEPVVDPALQGNKLNLTELTERYPGDSMLVCTDNLDIDYLMSTMNPPTAIRWQPVAVNRYEPSPIDPQEYLFIIVKTSNRIYIEKQAWIKD